MTGITWKGLLEFWLLIAILGTSLNALALVNAPPAKHKKPAKGSADEVPYVIRVNADGLLLDYRQHSSGLPLVEGKLVRDYLNATVFEGLRASNKSQVLIFVHGGMDDTSAALDHFWSDYQRILQGPYYPVFIVWPSGWSETYFEHLFKVRQGVKAETAGEMVYSYATSPLMLLSDVGRAITRTPMVIANNEHSDFETIQPARHLDDGAPVRQYAEFPTNYSVYVGNDYSSGWSGFTRGVSYWATLPVKLFVGSAIDGFGMGAWDNTVRRTQEVYPAKYDSAIASHLKAKLAEQENRVNEAPSDATSKSGKPLSKRQKKKAQRYLASGLPIFFDMLREKKQDGAVNDVTLVGHSMGTIILNRVLRDAPMDFNNIIYLGAACSIDDFTTSVLPYMKLHTNTEFYNMTLHPVAETDETYALDLCPRGSLLVWLDNFLVNPASEQERRFGRWRNLYRSSPTGEPLIRRMFDYDPSVSGRLHFRAFSVWLTDSDTLRDREYQWNDHAAPPSVSDIDGETRTNNPMTHTELGQAPYWNPAFWTVPPR